MAFHSPTFLLTFLPIVLLGFLWFERARSIRWQQTWLLVASLVFYGWASPSGLILFLPLTVVNYRLGRALSDCDGASSRLILGVGVGLNLMVLGYFKYAGFLVGSFAEPAAGAGFVIEDLLMPLGLSFIVFMQVAWLVASHRRQTVPCSYREFLLYACFFPQVVSGPIVYQQESLPQFRRRRSSRRQAMDLSVGGTLFVMGLAKKVLLADTLAPWAAQVFNAPANGEVITAVGAAIGALAFTLQLYFDFSGYSDMALGVARIFGIKLPLNFDSPYKATSISAFWHRWHMTLSRFLRDYVYIPLGGSRCGGLRRSTNLFVTMLLGGIWHGAGWTFVWWGALHGGYLVVAHLWRSWRRAPAWGLGGWAGQGVTFLAVMLAWVFFRAKSAGDAFHILSCLGGQNGMFIFHDPLFAKCAPVLRATLQSCGYDLVPQQVILPCLALTLAWVWFLPNSQQVLAAVRPGLLTYGKPIATLSRWQKALVWRPSPGWLGVMLVLLVWALLNISSVSHFLYQDF